jgi:outer membrane protein assembly factor BamB
MTVEITHRLAIHVGTTGVSRVFESVHHGRKASRSQQSSPVEPMPVELNAIKERLMQAKSVTPDDLEKLGRWLYGQLLPEHDPVTEVFQQQRRLRPNSGVRIEITLDSDYEGIPWESAHDGVDFVATRRQTPMVRIALLKRLETPARLSGKLNILVVGAAPTNGPKFQLEGFFTQMQAVFPPANRRQQQTSGGRQLRIFYEQHVTLLDMHRLSAEYIRQRTPIHILCFVCHGSATRIFLEDSKGNIDDTISAQVLNNKVLKQFPQLRAVYLMACETAAQPITESVPASFGVQPTTESVPASFALTLAKESSLAAVVAMQTQLTIGNGMGFTRSFFQDLALYSPLDVALAEARNQFSRITNSSQTNARQMTREMVAPVVYLNSASGQLFRAEIPYVQLLITALMIVLVVSGILLGVQDIQSQRAQLENERALAAQQAQALQTLAQREFIQQLPLYERPAFQLSEPRLFNRAVWVSTNQQTLIQYDRGQITPVNVGRGALPPVFSANKAWVVNTLDASLTQIPLNALSQASTNRLSVSSPNEPLVAYGKLWIGSSVSANLLVYDARTGNLLDEQRIGYDWGKVFAGGGFVWALQNHAGPQLLRISPTTLNSTIFTFEEPITQAHFFEDTLWLLLDQQRVVRYQPEPFQPIGEALRAPMPQRGLSVLGSGVWGIHEDGMGIVHYGEDSLQTISMDEPARTLFSTDEYLWVATDAGEVLAYSLADLQLMTRLTLPGSNAITQWLDADPLLYVLTPAENTLTVLDAREPALLRTFRPCEQPRGMAFDGSNIWLSCADQPNLQRISAWIYYIGTQDFQAGIYDSPPISDGEWLWIVQERSGQVVAFNGQTAITVSLQPNLLPLQLTHNAEGATELWTASRTGRQLYRLTLDSPAPSAFDLVNRQSNPRIHVEVSPILDREVDGTPLSEAEFNSFLLTEDRVWVTYLDINNLTNTSQDNLAVFHRPSMMLERSHRLGDIITGATLQDDDLWVTATQGASTRVFRLDTLAPNTIEEVAIPGTNTAYWSPVYADGKLWFTGGVPQLQVEDISQLILEIFGVTEGQRPPLYSLSLDDREWRETTNRLPPLPSLPTIAGHYLWYSSNVMYNINGGDASLPGEILAIHRDTLATQGPWSLCANPTYPRALLGWVWVGCQESEADLYRFDAQRAGAPCVYHGIGQDPHPPLLTADGKIWMVFQDTHNAAVFDSQSGDMLANYLVGESPSAPVIYQDEVYIYSYTEGTLQRLGYRNGEYDERPMVCEPT